MIRVSVKSEKEGELPRLIQYPGCNGAMPFPGNPRMTAIVKVSKENPAQGPHEVVAVLDTTSIVNIEEVSDEGQS